MRALLASSRPVSTSNSAPHTTCRDAASSSTGIHPERMSSAAALEEMDRLPANDDHARGFRPGHAPVAGRCVFCEEPVDQCVGNASPYHRHEALVLHTNVCGLERAKSAFAPIFPERYPSRVDVCPFTGKAPTRHGLAKYPPSQTDHVLRWSLGVKSPPLTYGTCQEVFHTRSTASRTKLQQ